jgi:hypothetical protein
MVIFLDDVYPLAVAEKTGNLTRNLVDADERASLRLATISKQKSSGCFNMKIMPRSSVLVIHVDDLVDVV